MNKVSLFLPMLSLIFVLALVILGYMYIDKKKKGVLSKAGFKEYSRHYLTSKCYISVVKIGDKFFYLGVSENGINNIAETTEEEINKYFLGTSSTEVMNNFAEVLKKMKVIERIKNKKIFVKDEKNEEGK